MVLACAAVCSGPGIGLLDCVCVVVVVAGDVEVSCETPKVELMK